MVLPHLCLWGQRLPWDKGGDTWEIQRALRGDTVPHGVEHLGGFWSSLPVCSVIHMLVLQLRLLH